MFCAWRFEHWIFIMVGGRVTYSAISSSDDHCRQCASWLVHGQRRSETATIASVERKLFCEGGFTPILVSQPIHGHKPPYRPIVVLWPVIRNFGPFCSTTHR